MPFKRPTLTQLRQSAVQDVVTSLSMTGSLLRNSVLRPLTAVVAQMVHGLYGYLDWVSRMAIPVTAEDEYLEAHAALRGITRVPAKAASGSITVAAKKGAFLPVGTVVRSAAGLDYATQAPITFITSTAAVQVNAMDEGAAYNLDAGSALTLVSSIEGVSPKVVTAVGISGGAETEDDIAFRDRVLDAYANPPQGGAVGDYVKWAKEVSGVTRAWARPNHAGTGTVAVWIMMDDASATGFPTGTGGAATMEFRDGSKATGDLLTVADYIDARRPATALVRTYAPYAEPINVTISHFSPDTPDNRRAVETALRSMIVANGSVLGGTLYPSQFVAAVENLNLVGPFTLVTPSIPVMSTLERVPTLGTVTYL